MTDDEIRKNIMGGNIDAVFEFWQSERSESQMTLGKMIQALRSLPADMPIHGLGELHSYRGYYNELAFEPSPEQETASSLLKRCVDAVGQVFMGYKGGYFMMNKDTPLWISPYGHSGHFSKKIMGITEKGEVVSEPEDE